jgi:hypothetical protein
MTSTTHQKMLSAYYAHAVACEAAERAGLTGDAYYAATATELAALNRAILAYEATRNA